jgi:type II secretory pathway component PulJ
MRHAFTLLEVVLATAITSLAVFPLLSALNSSSRTTRATRDQATGAMLALSVLERHRQLSPSVLAATLQGGDDVSVTSPGSLIVPEVEPGEQASDHSVRALKSYREFVGRQFRVSLKFEPVPAPAAGPVRQGVLSCTVTWSEPFAGGARSVSYALAAVVSDPVFPKGRDL